MNPLRVVTPHSISPRLESCTQKKYAPEVLLNATCD